MAKKFTIILIFVTLALFVTVSFVGTDRAIYFGWHIINSSTVTYKGVNILLPEDWWVFVKNEERMILSSLPQKQAEGLMLTVNVNSNVKRVDIKSFITQVCEGNTTELSELSISGEKTAEISCLNKRKNEIHYVWVVPSKNLLLMSSAPSETKKSVFYSLFNGVKF